MKKINILAFGAIMAMLLTSCIGKDGVDGQHGQVSVAFSWVGIVTYSDNISETPSFSLVNEKQYYEITPGTYTFQYVHNTLNPNSRWTKTYDFAADPGTKGTKGAFMTDGVDGTNGEDLYYTIGLWSDGPTVYRYTSAVKSGLVSGSVINDITGKLLKERLLLANPTEKDILIIKKQ